MTLFQRPWKYSMHGMVPDDAQSDVSNFHYAVIHTRKQNRKRFPASIVECVDSAEAAYQKANTESAYAAQVHGPSRSSESQYIYYLVKWL